MPAETSGWSSISSKMGEGDRSANEGGDKDAPASGSRTAGGILSASLSLLGIGGRSSGGSAVVDPPDGTTPSASQPSFGHDDRIDTLAGPSGSSNSPSRKSSGSPNATTATHRVAASLSPHLHANLLPGVGDMDVTPRAEHPPPLLHRATIVPGTSASSSSGHAADRPLSDEEERLGEGSSGGPTRESTIKGRDSAKTRSGLDMSAEGSGSGKSSPLDGDTVRRRQPGTGRKDSRRDSYFPDVDSHFGQAPSPTAAAASSSPRTKPDLRRRRSSDNEPWPSSARHGPTPPGMGMGMGGLMRSLSAYPSEAISPLSMEDQAAKASPGISTGLSESDRGWAERALEQYAATADATGLRMGAEGAGWEVSTALSPPPGYPMGSRASGSRSSSGGGSLPGSNESSPPVSPSANSEHRGSVASTSSGWSSAPSVGIVGSYASTSSVQPGTPMQGDVAPLVMPRNPATDHDTYEGTITIDTSPARYVISAKLDGFRLDDITIAVKSVSPASSSASRSSVSSRMSDSASIRSAFSTTSGNGGQPTFEPRTRSTSKGATESGDPPVPGWMAEMASSSASRPKPKGGKVLHLLADRWDDNAHFERRITFGTDADFSGGVKAKFDGSDLRIEVPRRVIKRPTDRLSMASPSIPGSSPPSLPEATALPSRNWEAAVREREDRYAAAKMTDWQATAGPALERHFSE